MNPLTNMKNVKKLSEQELQRNFKTSWHDQYRSSAWIFIGGLPYDLTEGDIICVFSQYGEIVNINLVRDKDSGKQKGFCFICYEDQRSTDLAVDNFNGIKILGRIIRVDHVTDYKMPKDKKVVDAETRKIQEEGCGPNVQLEKRPQMPIPSTELPDFAKEIEAPPDGFRLPPRLPIGLVKTEKEDEEIKSKVKLKKEKKQNKDKKRKKSKKKHKKKHVSSSESSSESSGDSSSSENETSSEDVENKHSKKSKHKSKKEKKKSISESEDESKNSKTSKHSKDDENSSRKNEDEKDSIIHFEERRDERKYYTSREDYLKYRTDDKIEDRRNDKYDRDYDRSKRNDYEREDRKRENERRDRDRFDAKRYRK